jgi:F0F1-type ATP synthase assembly protein I
MAGLGGMLAGAVIVPMLIGIGIDSVAHSGPLFFLIGLGVGVVGAIVTGYTRFKRFL